MGYEKGITRKWLRMVLHGEYPDSIPGFPKTPDTPGRGTPNHQLLAHLARVTWALQAGSLDDTLREQEFTEQFFLDQYRTGFMSRGSTTEQLSPSHSQWWISGVVGLRWSTIKFEADDLRRQRLKHLTGHWLRSHHALCRLFSTPRGIVAPGARAWPFKNIVKHSTPPYSYSYGRSTLRDELYSSIERGKVRKVWDPESNLDMASMYFVNELFKLGDDLGGAKQSTSKDIPYLKWPIRYERTTLNPMKDQSFSGWMPNIEGSRGLTVQRFAGWIDGREVYGTEDFDPGDIVLTGGREVRTIGDKKQ